jgi:hypothetical protein
MYCVRCTLSEGGARVLAAEDEAVAAVLAVARVPVLPVGAEAERAALLLSTALPAVCCAAVVVAVEAVAPLEVAEPPLIPKSPKEMPSPSFTQCTGGASGPPGAAVWLAFWYGSALCKIDDRDVSPSPSAPNSEKRAAEKSKALAGPSSCSGTGRSLLLEDPAFPLCDADKSQACS